LSEKVDREGTGRGSLEIVFCKGEHIENRDRTHAIPEKKQPMRKRAEKNHGGKVGKPIKRAKG